MSNNNILTFSQKLQQQQQAYLEKFKKSQLMLLATSNKLEDSSTRQKLLDNLQTFSDFFQKAVMLRYIFSEEQPFLKIAQEHLTEEYGHNTSLSADRSHRPIHFDPIIESGASWFAWKMFTADNLQKTVLIHWVLEASANLFFNAAHETTKNFGETNYFKTHSVLDQQHEMIDPSLLESISEREYQALAKILDHGWAVLKAVTDQIAKVSL